MTTQRTTECPASSPALDLFHSWLQSNPRQHGYAIGLAAKDELPVSLELLTDWADSLLRQGAPCWPFPPLRFAELMSLSTLRRDLRWGPLTEQDIIVLHSRLLKLVPVMFAAASPPDPHAT